MNKRPYTKIFAICCDDFYKRRFTWLAACTNRRHDCGRNSLFALDDDSNLVILVIKQTNSYLNRNAKRAAKLLAVHHE